MGGLTFSRWLIIRRHFVFQNVLGFQRNTLESLCKEVLTFESVDEILKYDHSNESYGSVLSCGAVHYTTQDAFSLEEYTWKFMKVKGQSFYYESRGGTSDFGLLTSDF